MDCNLVLDKRMEVHRAQPIHLGFMCKLLKDSRVEYDVRRVMNSPVVCANLRNWRNKMESNKNYGTPDVDHTISQHVSRLRSKHIPNKIDDAIKYSFVVMVQTSNLEGRVVRQCCYLQR